MTKVLLTYLKEYICTTLEFNFLQKLRLDIAVLRSVHWEVQSVSDQGPLSFIFLPFFFSLGEKVACFAFFRFPLLLLQSFTHKVKQRDEISNV